jgi:hypothetical protein
MMTMAELGIAWLDNDDRELGSIGGQADLERAVREAAAGLVKVFPAAARAVVYEGRSLSDGRVIEEVRRGPDVGVTG